MQPKKSGGKAPRTPCCEAIYQPAQLPSAAKLLSWLAVVSCDRGHWIAKRLEHADGRRRARPDLREVPRRQEARKVPKSGVPELVPDEVQRMRRPHHHWQWDGRDAEQVDATEACPTDLHANYPKATTGSGTSSELSDDRALGFAFSWVSGDEWLLAQLFVSPDRQGCGTGPALLERTLAHDQRSKAPRR